jgi:hypothetical protein
MTTTTALARDSHLLGDVEYLDRWRAYVGSEGYDDEQTAIVTALFNAQRDEFNKGLPAGCTWMPSLSQVHGPAGTQLPDLAELMLHATAVVLECYLEIEADALARMTDT